MGSTLLWATGMLVTLTLTSPLTAAHGQGGNKPRTQDPKEPSIQDGYHRKDWVKQCRHFRPKSEV